MKIEEANYFYCKLRSVSCPTDLLGHNACDTCEENGKCNNCGRGNTVFCLKCTNLKILKTRRNCNGK